MPNGHGSPRHTRRQRRHHQPVAHAALANGYMETEVTAHIHADSERNRDIVIRMPAGRWGKPADITGAAAFPASDADSFTHGAILPVGGNCLIAVYEAEEEAIEQGEEPEHG